MSGDGARYVVTEDQLIALMDAAWGLPPYERPASGQVGSPGHRLLVATGIIPGEGKRWCDYEYWVGGEVHACELVEGHADEHVTIVSLS